MPIGRPATSPCKPRAVDQSVMIASAYAAVAAASALYDAERSGQGHLIDVSGQECIAHSLQNALQVYDLEGIVSSRGGEGARDAAEDLLACKDGRVAVASPLGLGPSWFSLTAWVQESGHPAADVLTQPRWRDANWRKTQAARDEFRAAFGSFIAGYTREEIMAQALKRKIVMSPVSKIGDILADKQLAYRDYFVPVAGIAAGREVQFPGAPYQFSELVWAVSPPPAGTDIQ
jgi:benzylsuccinate CoA-transferase BbsE subunit